MRGIAQSRPRMLLALGGAAGVLGLAGCGETAAQHFYHQVNPVQQQIQTERSQIAATLQASHLNDPRTARVLNQEIGTLAGIVEQLPKVMAPDPGSQRAFNTYISAYRMLVASLYHVATLVAHGSAHQIQNASTAATDAAGAVQRANDALDSALAGPQAPTTT